MVVKSDQVFLVSGQMQAHGEPNRGPVVQQCVVVAESDRAAYECLALQKPNFRPLGLSTLEDHEKAVADLRAVLNKTGKNWDLLFSKGMELSEVA